MMMIPLWVRTYPPSTPGRVAHVQAASEVSIALSDRVFLLQVLVLALELRGLALAKTTSSGIVALAVH